jgi:hypothetical protein
MTIEQLPATRIEHNLRLIAHHTLDGAPNTGEGIAMKVTADGRRLLYVANEHPPIAMSILDVTDPAAPELIWQLPTRHDKVRGNSLALRGDVLVMASQVIDPGDEPAGFFVFDISDPTSPKEVSFFDTSGPHSRGVHLITTMDGEYVHLATGAPDFEPKPPVRREVGPNEKKIDIGAIKGGHLGRDDQFYMIVDIRDRANPTEVGRWWLPGQRVGDPETIERHKELDFAFRVHHALSYPERPDRAYLGYIDAGMIILDIADKANPKMISRLDYHPPMPGFTHTVVPLFERNLAVVADEASGDMGTDWPKRVWIVDIRDEEHPLIISSLPVPDDFDALHEEGGRIGAHNIHENEPEPGTAKLLNTVVATWFSAGLRIYDIRDPFTPKEIAAFLPETPEGQRGCRINDCFVDDRGIVYATDRVKGGVYVLEYTGDIPLD